MEEYISSDHYYRLGIVEHSYSNDFNLFLEGLN